MVEWSVSEASDAEALRAEIQVGCDCLQQIYDGGRYPRIQVRRPWSAHNPVLTGKVARPSAYRWYLIRELYKLAQRGATVEVEPSRERFELCSPDLLAKLDEGPIDVSR